MFANAFFILETQFLLKPITMKALTKKLLLAKPAELLRNLSISLLCIGFIALMLYVLINSPA